MINNVVTHILEIIFAVFIINCLLNCLFKFDLISEVMKLWNKLIYKKTNKNNKDKD